MSPVLPDRRRRMNLRALVGSGDRIMLFTLPFAVVGLILNAAYPSVFGVGGPPGPLRMISAAVLTAGVVIWAWCVGLVLTRVPRGELITSGPYAIVKHPLYTAVALLVLPWLGFVFDTWLGVPVGSAMYLGVRLFAPAEEAALAQTFGGSWTAYVEAVKVRWL